MQTVFDGFHRTTRGSVERPEFYRHILTGAFDFHEQAPDRKLRAAVHLDDAGEPDGYVLYRHDRSGEIRAIDVVDLVALTPEVYLRLWQLPRRVDLVQRVRWDLAPTHDPLEWALVEPAGAEGDEDRATSCGCGCSMCRPRWPHGRGAPTGRW